MIRVGFLGTGWTDLGQIKAFQKGGLAAQAIFSRNYSKAQAIAEKYHIPEIYTDWKKLIASPTIDFVSIVLPTWLHAEAIKYARKFKKPFICEAPFLSVNEVKNLITNNHTLEIIDYELRLTPHFRKIKNLISLNEIGEVKAFEFVYLNNFARNPALKWDWSNDIQMGGGYLNLVGGHFIDLSNWLFGNCKRVLKSEFDFCGQSRKNSDGIEHKKSSDDYALLEMEYPNNLVGKILVSQMSEIEEKLSFTVFGTNGVLNVENNEILLKKGDSFSKVILDYDEELFTGPDNNLFTIGSYFLAQKIKTRLEKQQNTGLPNLKDALRNQAILQEAYKALPEKAN